MSTLKTIVVNGNQFDIVGSEPIYEELGMSLDRFVTLLSRDAYTPTLSAKPDGSVSQYTDGQDGSTNHYSVGQTVVYPDSGMADGLGMSIVKAVNSDGSVVWGDLFPKTNVYVGSTLYSCDTDGAVRLPAYPTVPTSLKCPYYLYIQGNGTSLGSYNGASSKTINITPSSIGAAEASHTHSGYLTSHQSIYSLTIQGNGTTIDTYTPNSASKTINITPAGIGAAAASHTHAYSSITGTPTDRIKFGLVGTSYVGAIFLDTSLAEMAASTYIEWRQSPNGWFNHKAGKYIVSGGTASHFLKGDGSLDNTAYAAKATTLAGYGITDGVKIVHLGSGGDDALLSTKTYSVGTTAKSDRPNQTECPTGYGNYISLAYNATKNMALQIYGDTSSLNKGIYYRTRQAGDTFTDYRGWRLMLDESNYVNYTVKKDGTGATGTWGISITGNAASATKLQTARSIWGQTFDGTANVSGAMTGVTSITIGDCVISYDSTNKVLKFSTGIYSEDYVSANGA